MGRSPARRRLLSPGPMDVAPGLALSSQILHPRLEGDPGPQEQLGGREVRCGPLSCPGPGTGQLWGRGREQAEGEGPGQQQQPGKGVSQEAGDWDRTVSPMASQSSLPPTLPVGPWAAPAHRLQLSLLVTGRGWRLGGSSKPWERRRCRVEGQLHSAESRVLAPGLRSSPRLLPDAPRIQRCWPLSVDKGWETRPSAFLQEERSTAPPTHSEVHSAAPALAPPAQLPPVGPTGGLAVPGPYPDGFLRSLPGQSGRPSWAPGPIRLRED